MANAKAPSKATANIRLNLGLVSVPVQFFTATEPTKPVERKTFTPDGRPVGQLKVVKGTDEIVSDTVMMAQAAEGWVVLSDDEIATATAGTAVNKGDVPIEGFVPLAQLSEHYFVSGLYQARPTPLDKGVVDLHATRAYLTLLAGMEKKQVAALFKVGLRSHARYAALSPDGLVRFLYFDDEVREALPMPDVDINPVEVSFVEEYIEALEPDAPDLENTARELIQAFIAKKAAGGVVDVEPAPDKAPTNVIDLTAALKASVAAAKSKPKKIAS